MQTKTSRLHISSANFLSNKAGHQYLRKNEPTSKITIDALGGAVFCGDDTQFIQKPFNAARGKLFIGITHSTTFANNSAFYGGAAAFARVPVMYLSLISFRFNGGVHGGALYLESNGDINPKNTFNSIQHTGGENLVFENNAAITGGAIFVRMQWAAPLWRSGVLPNNISHVDKEKNVFFEGCRFLHNVAVEAGGALNANGARLGCINCRFAHNIVNNDDGNGGAIIASTQSAFYGRGVQFYDNAAGNGGAIYADDSLIDLVDAMMTNNIARDNGGGLYVDATQRTRFQAQIVARLSNLRVKGNEARIGGTM